MINSGRPFGATCRTAPNSSPPSETNAWNPTLIFSCTTYFSSMLLPDELRHALSLEGRDAFLVVGRATCRALCLSFAFQNCKQAHRLFVDSTHEALRLHKRRSGSLRNL